MVAVGQRKGHVPHRSCRLTAVLRESLGGNCLTHLVANVWPEPRHMEETLSTLKFAAVRPPHAHEVTLRDGPTRLSPFAPHTHEFTLCVTGPHRSALRVTHCRCPACAEDNPTTFRPPLTRPFARSCGVAADVICDE